MRNRKVIRVKIVCASLTNWKKCSQNTFTNGLSLWQSLRLCFKFYWALPIQAGGFETQSFFHMILQTQRQAFELKDDHPRHCFHLKFVTSLEWKIIWIPNAVSGELVVKVLPLKLISPENNNGTNLFMLIKLKLHAKHLCCCLIWLLWCRPIK